VGAINYFGGVNMEPDKYTKLEFKYFRKAAIAHQNNQKIRYIIYSFLSKHYEKKHLKKFLSS
jgi:hypothetical protein